MLREKAQILVQTVLCFASKHSAYPKEISFNALRNKYINININTFIHTYIHIM